MCVIVLGAQSGTSTKPRDNERHLADYFWSGECSVWRVAWMWEEEKWRQSPPVSRAKQRHGNGLMLRDSRCVSHRRGKRSPCSSQRPAWHSKLAEQIPAHQSSSQGSCWHSLFSSPAKDSMPYLRTEQQCSIPENDICTGRSVQTKNAHVAYCQNRITE